MCVDAGVACALFVAKYHLLRLAACLKRDDRLEMAEPGFVITIFSAAARKSSVSRSSIAGLSYSVVADSAAVESGGKISLEEWSVKERSSQSLRVEQALGVCN